MFWKSPLFINSSLSFLGALPEKYTKSDLEVLVGDLIKRAGSKRELEAGSKSKCACGTNLDGSDLDD